MGHSTDLCTHKIIFDDCTGENLCCQCGSVFFSGLDDIGMDFDSSFYRSTRNAFENNSFFGSSAFAADFSLNGLLSSKISESYKDYSGKRIKDTNKIKRMIYANKYLVNPDSNNDKSKRNAMRTILGVVGKMCLPEHIIERSAKIYTKAYKQKAVRGRSTFGLSLASIFYACKEAGIPRDADDFVRATEMSSKEQKRWRNELFSNYKTLIDILGLRAPEQISTEFEIPHIAGKCDLSEKTTRRALEIYHKLRGHNETLFFGKSPIAVAVCCLFIASKYTDELIKQDLVTEAADVSTVTLRKRCDEYVAILELLKETIPEFFIDQSLKRLETDVLAS